MLSIPHFPELKKSFICIKKKTWEGETMNGQASAKGDMRMSGNKDGEQRKGAMTG